jgi:hypothetical protein
MSEKDSGREGEGVRRRLRDRDDRTGIPGGEATPPLEPSPTPRVRRGPLADSGAPTVLGEPPPHPPDPADEHQRSYVENYEPFDLPGGFAPAEAGSHASGPLGGGGEPDEDDEDVSPLRFYGTIAALVVVAVVVLFFAGRLLFGGTTGDQAPAVSGDSGAKPGALGSLAAEQVQNVAVEDTGIVFDEPKVDDKTGEVEIVTHGGDGAPAAWRGTKTSSDDGETWELEGPTYAKFHRGFELPGGGAVMYGNFAVAKPNEPVIHGTLHRVTVGGEEDTEGTYFYFDENGVQVKGFYDDERHGDKVVRTYTEPRAGGARTFAKSFSAPPGTLVPELVGWEAPRQ